MPLVTWGIHPHRRAWMGRSASPDSDEGSSTLRQAVQESTFGDHLSTHFRPFFSPGGHWEGALRLAICTTVTLVLSVCGSGHKSVVPFREMRYEGVIGQTNPSTCGAAAVATLLTHFYGTTASEQEILCLAEGSMRSREEHPQPEGGLTAYDLRIALEKKGIEVVGFLVTAEDLQDYFHRGGLPLIAHVTEPHKHFLVVIGMSGEQVLLADPSWGRCVVLLAELVQSKKMSGVVLVPLPASEQVALVRENQATALDWMRLRLAALNALREAMP